MRNLYDVFYGNKMMRVRAWDEEQAYLHANERLHRVYRGMIGVPVIVKIVLSEDQDDEEIYPTR